MINEEDNTISLLSQDGTSKKYDVLLMFESENDDLYIVYTDHELDEDGFTKTYAGIYKDEDGKKSLLPVETDEEMELIDQLLKKLEKKEGVTDEEVS